MNLLRSMLVSFRLFCFFVLIYFLVFTTSLVSNSSEQLLTVTRSWRTRVDLASINQQSVSSYKANANEFDWHEAWQRSVHSLSTRSRIIYYCSFKVSLLKRCCIFVGQHKSWHHPGSLDNKPIFGLLQKIHSDKHKCMILIVLKDYLH